MARSHPAFFDNKKMSMAHIVLMMETTLGMEHHGDDRCQTCINLDIPCVRYIEGAELQISRTGSACAWCRFQNHSGNGGCSKVDQRQKRKRVEMEHSDEEDENEQSTLDGMEARARSATDSVPGAVAQPDDDGTQEPDTITRGAGETTTQSGLSSLDIKAEDPVVLPDQLHQGLSSSDHPILRLEDMIDELSEDDAQEAQALIVLIKRNLEKGRDIQGHASLLKNLLAPVKARITGEYYSLSAAKQRVADKYKRISNDVAQAAQKKKLFDDADEAPGAIKVEE